jgi:nitric oxide reductase large subunit
VTHQPSYSRQIAIFIGLAIGGWIGYLVVFQHFFPNDYDPSDSRGVFWTWLISATVLFVVVMLGSFRILSTPPRWRPAMAIAGIAPALVLDCLATTFYLDWFSSSGPHEATAYSATVLGGAGTMLLVALWLGNEREGSH